MYFIFCQWGMAIATPVYVKLVVEVYEFLVSTTPMSSITKD